jgi:hypothetical protein
MADRRIRRKRGMWLWVVVILLIVALIWLFLTPEWYGETVSEGPPGTDVRTLERQPVPPPEPNSFGEYDRTGTGNGSRPEK